VTTLVDLDRDSLSDFAGELSTAARWPLDFPSFPLAAEVADVVLGLVALADDRELGETWLRLSTRLAVDSTVTLFTADDEALTAAVVFDQRAQRMRFDLTFLPARKPAASAARVARFLSTLSEANAIALRLPDGTLTPERMDVPTSLVVDPRLVRLLDLLADVGRLSHTTIPVPAHVDEELINDLLVARRLLQGQDVKGTWTSGELRLRPEGQDFVKAELAKADRHQFMTIADTHLDVEGTLVPLGEIRQVFADAEVDSLDEDGDEIVLRLRAANGTAASVMSPVRTTDLTFEPNVQLSDDAFDELVGALDSPPEVNPLRNRL